MENNLNFEKAEFEKLMELLGLSNNQPETYEDSDYFNAWGFGLKKEDCEFTIEASMPSGLRRHSIPAEAEMIPHRLP